VGEAHRTEGKDSTERIGETIERRLKVEVLTAIVVIQVGLAVREGHEGGACKSGTGLDNIPHSHQGITERGFFGSGSMAMGIGMGTGDGRDSG
jgi:hypothetical protein